MTEFMWEKPWEDTVVDRYLKPESGSKSEDEFYRTHVKNDRIYARKLDPDSYGEFITEDDLLNRVLESKVGEDNSIYVITGETGSGKSQLCDWLSYEIDKREGPHISLHISRSKTNLEDIIDVIAREFDSTTSIGSVSDINPEKAADAIVTTLMAFGPSQDRLKDIDIQKFAENREGDIDLYSVLTHNIEQYMEQVDTGKPVAKERQGLNLLTEEDYRELSKAAFDRVLQQEREFQRLRDSIHRVFAQNLGIYDFQEQLRTYSEKYEENGLRPVLIAEDLTTFNVLKEQLMDQIFELESTAFDVVLGWTTGWESENLEDTMASTFMDSETQDVSTYMLDRLKGYLRLSDETGASYFLEDSVDKRIELFNNYLEAIIEDSDGSFPETNEVAFDGVYPFNERFIQTAYYLMSEVKEQVTPRTLITEVIAPCLHSSDPPFQTMETIYEPGGLLEKPISAKYGDAYRQLAQWYARIEDPERFVILPIGIFDSFGMELPDEAILEEDEGSVKFDKARTFTSGLEFIESGAEQPEVSTGISPEQKRKRAEFQEWVAGGEEYPSSETLISGVQQVLTDWSNLEPTRLGNPAGIQLPSEINSQGIFYSLGEGIPVDLEGVSGHPGRINVRLSQKNEFEGLYATFLLRELEGAYPSRTDFDAVRQWSTERIYQFRRDMREDIGESIPGELSIEGMIALANLLILNAENGTTRLEKRQLFRTIEVHDEGKIFPRLLRDQGDLEDTYLELASKIDSITGLTNEFFRIQSKLINHNKIMGAISEIDDIAHVSNLYQGFSPESLAEAYRVGERRGSDTRFKNLVNSLKEYLEALQTIDQSEILGEANDWISSVTRWDDYPHSLDNLRDNYHTIYESLPGLDVPVRDSWQDLDQLLATTSSQESLVDFQEDIERLQNPEINSRLDLVKYAHQFESSREGHRFWEVYGAIDEMLDAIKEVDVSETKGLKSEIEDSDMFSTHVELREDILNTDGNFLEDHDS